MAGSTKSRFLRSWKTSSWTPLVERLLRKFDEDRKITAHVCQESRAMRERAHQTHEILKAEGFRTGDPGEINLLLGKRAF